MVLLTEFAGLFGQRKNHEDLDLDFLLSAVTYLEQLMLHTYSCLEKSELNDLKIKVKDQPSEQTDSLLTLKAEPAQQKAACIPPVLA